MKSLRIHYFQHVPFEGPGCIEAWASECRHELKGHQLYLAPDFPDPDEVDWLIVLGGPMGVYDESDYPWLAAEKKYIGRMMELGKTVIGICLGAQLIAELAGAKVFPNPVREIGWFPVTQIPGANRANLLQGIDPQFTTFHWHGDTFGLPPGALHLFRSDACANQAFLLGERVLGLQFHFEVTPHSLAEMIRHGRHELIEDRFVQSETVISDCANLIQENNQMLFRILANLSVLQN